MTDWRTYVSQRMEEIEATDQPIERAIMCPRCGAPVYKDTTTILMTNPPQYEYFCKECDWSEFFF